MHLRLRKCEKSPQTYRKLADLRLRNTSCSFAEFAVAELSLNLRCPALDIYMTLPLTPTIFLPNWLASVENRCVDEALMRASCGVHSAGVF